MSRCRAVARPLVRQLRHPSCALRPFTTGASRAAEVQEQHVVADAASSAEPSALDLDPDTVLPEFEMQLMKAGKMPVGSRRRRVALRNTPNIPFEHLPYQAFQEARKILAADREDKLSKIRDQLDKMSLLESKDASEMAGGQKMKEIKLANIRREVERLKLLADVNDPMVKKRFEDGLGDMNKPIYRALAEKKWRSYDYRLITQRIKQFSIVPDVLPKFEPTADVQLFFRQSKVAPGAVVDSLISERAPRLRVQVFDKGERLITVVVLDSDVPDVESDGFSKRCHYLAANVPLSPTDTSLPLSKVVAENQLAVPWLPAFSQKGAPYHRMGIFLLEQKPGQEVDVSKLKELYSGRDGFSLKSMRDKFDLRPFGFNMFRSVWDDNTAAVMARHEIPGADVELRRTRVHSLKPPVKPRGWEAKRQGPKYRHLWKYTKNIKGISNARGWIKKR
ncbi:hypothetical protein E4U42_001504 [Claviceps africana]|uniref:Large ribosomal subunit protein mL38 n=1 Tax=Claviceps africana TaxID=83212 RepID=A0A8K0JBR2_9HYPO|nr:hypothetical protein E4U42_001504 [Claviceps africana]